MTQKQKVVDSTGNSEKGVTTRDEEDQEGEGNRLKHPDRQGVGFHVVDGDEGLVVLPHKHLTELKADAQAQGQARLHSGGHSWELAWVHVAPLQSLLDHTLYVFSVELLGHCRDDATSPAAFKREEDYYFLLLIILMFTFTINHWIYKMSKLSNIQFPKSQIFKLLLLSNQHLKTQRHTI